MSHRPDNPVQQRLDLLAGFDLFQDLDRKELVELDELLYRRVYEKDEIVFEEGAIGHGLYLIISGKIHANPRNPLLKSVVLEFGPGQVLGELCLFEEGPRTATAMALEPTAVAALFRAELLSITQKNKNIGVKVLFNLLRILSQRARHLLLDESHVPSL